MRSDRPQFQALWAGIPLLLSALLMPASLPAQGVINPTVLNTVPGAALSSGSALLTFTDTVLDPTLQLKFGFATAEAGGPGQLADAFTLTLQDTGLNLTFVLVTVDAAGPVWAPVTPGTTPLSPSQLAWSPIAYPSLTPVLPQQWAYDLEVALPAEVSGRTFTLYFDLFNNDDALPSQGWFTEVTVVPEPRVWALLGLGAAMLWWRNRRAQWLPARAPLPNLNPTLPLNPHLSPALRPVPELESKLRSRSTIRNELKNLVCALWLLLCLLGAGQASAQDRTFRLNDTDLSLAEVTPEADVYFRSMRLNRALNVWNVEVTVSNKVGRVLAGPVVLLIDGFSGTTGAQQPDGTTTDGKGYFDLSAQAGDGALSPGEVTVPRTLTLGRTASGSPSLTTKLFAARPPVAAALGVTRSLDEAGRPLPGVALDITGPVGPAQQTSDAPSGVASFGQGAGEHVVKFSTDGYLPVWRKQSLTLDQTTVLPNPRLTKRSTGVFNVTPLGGTIVSNAAGTIAIEFGAGVVSQAGEVRLTTLTGQNLPAFLPLGWSPLNAFWLESSSPVTGTVAAQLRPIGPISPTETAALAKWNDVSLQWLVVQTFAGNGTNSIAVTLTGAGAYALVASDAGALAPPSAQLNQPLPASTVAAPGAVGLSATGDVTPPASPASVIPEFVTGTANLVVTHATANLPSGYLLRGEVTETYLLADGSLRLTPQYEHFIVGYQRPGDQDPRTLHAAFPMRPVLLFGSDQLEEATVRVDVLPEQPFDGQVLDAGGGQVGADGVRLLAGSGRLTGPSAIRLRRLDATVFTNLVSAGQDVVAAFDLTVDGSTLTGTLGAQLTGAPTNGLFVVARVLSEVGFYGLQPVERLQSDAQGNLSSLEPLTGERLPGLRGSGQFVLVRVGAAQGLISGVARNGQGQVQVNMPVRLTGLPWLTLSDVQGRFQLVAPVGEVELRVTDPLTGDTGFVSVTIPDPQTPVDQDVGTAPAGPRVAQITPAHNATKVPRVGSVVIRFNEAVNPGTVIGNAIQLLKPDNSVVTTALTLNLRNTIATLSPAVELEAGTTYRVRLAATIADPTGRPLEGQSEFSFTTVPLSTRVATAQLIIYEPGATNVPAAILDDIPAFEPGEDPFAIVVHGQPGVADPEVPVILVNESTGETQTVLSKVDGSFSSFVSGTEEDFVSATFVNLNSTRVYVPVSRQEFDNGFVGLYPQGGILEAQSDGGPVRVIIEPGAIDNKSKLRLSSLSQSEIARETSGSPPEGAQLMGTALRLEVDGEQLKQGINVSMPVDLAALGFPPNEDPTEAAIALTMIRDQVGVRGYEVLNQMRFVPGEPATAQRFGNGKPRLQDEFTTYGAVEAAISFVPGGDLALGVFQFVVLPLLLGNKPVVVTGRTVSAPQYDGGNALGNLVVNQFLQAGLATPLGGTWVMLRPASAGEGRAGRLQPGMVYSTSGRDGRYLLVAPTATAGYVITATHPRFSDRQSQPVLPLLEYSLAGAVNKDFIFTEPLDFQSPPQINVAHTPLFPAPGQTVHLQVNASHGAATAPNINVFKDRVVPLAEGVEATLEGVFLDNITQEVIQGNRKRWSADLRATNAVQVFLRIETTAGAGTAPAAEPLLYSIAFDGNVPQPPNSTIPPSDPNDSTGPVVTVSFPGEGGILNVGEALRLQFNEPIDKLVEENLAGVQLSGPGGVPFLVTGLSGNQRELTVRVSGLQPDSEYTLTIEGSSIRDLKGNQLDQKPSTEALDSFSLRFRTAPLVQTQLGAVEIGGGAVVNGTRLFTIDRGQADALVIYDLQIPSQPVELGRVPLRDYPRDLVVIPNYSYKLKADGPVKTGDIVGVVGGVLGGTVDELGNVFQEGQFLRLYDVTDPANPIRLATPIISYRVAAITKVRWEPPNLAYMEFGADIQFIGLVNLQEMLIGFNASTAESAAFPPNGDPGDDKNNDGDYVDDSERVPLPQKEPAEFYGKRFSYVLDQTPQRLLDFALTGGILGVTMREGQRFDAGGNPVGPLFPPTYRTVTFGGVDIDRAAGSFDFAVGANPKRVAIFDPLLIEIDGELATPVVALVSLSPDADGKQKLAVIDITLPESPHLLRKIEIPDELAGGFIQSISRNAAGLLELATTQHQILLDPKLLSRSQPDNDGLHPAIVGSVPYAGAGSFSIGNSPYGVHAISHGGRNVVLQSAPQMSFVSFPDRADVVDLDNLGTNEVVLNELFAGSRTAPAIIPGRLRSVLDAASDLDPPSPRAHYHVLVEAPGGAGESIQLGLETLNLAGKPRANLGLGFPPVRAASADTVNAMGQEPRECDAPTGTLVAHRLSDDPRSAYYNRYLSVPFALTYERVSIPELAELEGTLERRILYSGAFLRAFIDKIEENNPALAPFVSEVDDDLKVVRPVASAVVPTLDSSYIMGANPSPAGGYVSLPGTFGTVAAHNGEFRHETIDIALPSRRRPIEFERVIAGRDLYEGPFGRGWDFNYNQRVVELSTQLFPAGRKMPLVVRDTQDESAVGESRDVLFHTGAGRILHFQHQAESPPPEIADDPLVEELDWFDTASDYYLPEPGSFDILAKFEDGRFERLEPDGTRYLYGSNGRLEAIVDRYPDNRQELEYDRHGWLVRVTDKSVTADRFVEIGYFRFAADSEFNSEVDEATDNPFREGRIRRLKDYAERDVLFTYDEEGILLKREGPLLGGENGGFSGRPVVNYVWTGCNLQGVIPGNDGVPLFASAVSDNNTGESTVTGGGSSMAGPVGVSINGNTTAATLAGHTASSTLSDGTTKKLTFDKLGYPTELETASGPSGGSAKVEQKFSALGLLEFVKHPEGNSETRTYDTNNPVFRSRGNLLSVTYDPGPRGGDVLSESWSYDSKYNLYSGTHRDLNGNSITYTLSDSGRDVHTVSYPGAGALILTHNEYGQVESEVRPNGVTIGYGYNAATGFQSSQTLGENETTFEYDDSVGGKLGKPTSIVPPRGIAWNRKYNALLSLVENTRGDLIEKFAYDEFSNPTLYSRTVGEGKTLLVEQFFTKKVFMEGMKVSGVEIDGAQSEFSYVYIPDEQLRVKEIHHPGALQSFTYDNRGNVKTMTLGNYTEEFVRDLHGNVVGLKRGGDTVETSKYDGHDRAIEVRRITSTGEDFEERSYHGGGELKSVKVTDATYGVVLDRKVPSVDSLGRPLVENIVGTEISYSEGYSYTAGSGGSVSIIGPRQTVKRTWNTAGHSVGIEDASTAATYTPNANGFVEEISLAESGASFKRFFGYDELDNLQSLGDDFGTLFDYTPRADGRPTVTKNGRQNSSMQSYTVLGDLISRKRPDGMEFKFHYNERRQPTFMGDSQDGRSFKYEDSFRQTSMTLRNGGEYTYSGFDGRNRPTTITTPAGGMTLGHDLQGRLITHGVTAASGNFDLAFKYDALNRLREATYNGQTARFAFDTAGPLLEAAYSETGGDFTVGYSLYSDGQRKTVTYPSGTVVEEDRDGAGRLLGIKVDGVPVYVVEAWNGNANPRTVNLGNGIISVANEYDTRPRLTSTRSTRQSDGKVLVDMRLLYDGADNVTARQFVHQGGRADFFTYDNGERVDTAHLGARPFAVGAAARTEGNYSPVLGGFGPGYCARDYGYDGGGHDLLLSASLIKPASLTVPPFASTWAAHDDFLHAVNVDGFDRGAPDPLGNVGRTRLYVRPVGATGPVAVPAALKHNGLSMLTRVERDDGLNIDNEYQHTGLRHFRKVTQGSIATSATAYVYDEGKLIEEYDVTGSSADLRGRYYYALDDAPVAADLWDAGTAQLRRYYYLRDQAFSVVAVVDGNGNAVERVRYDTFGQPTLEGSDTVAPRLTRVVAGAGGSWLVELSEPVLPALASVGTGSGLVTHSPNLDEVVTAVDSASNQPISGGVVLEETLAGFAFSSVLRFTPAGPVTGPIQLTLQNGRLADEWGNTNSTTTVTFASGPPGTVLFQSSGAASTAPPALARSAVGNPFLFQGQYFDYDTGLVYMRARFYDPFTGQFLEQDPAGYEDSVNLFAGLGNNPVSYRDPTGTAKIPIVSRGTRVAPIPSPVPKSGRRLRPDPSHSSGVSISRTKPERTPRPKEASIQVDERQIAKRSSDPTSRREAMSREQMDREFARMDAEEAARASGPQALQRTLDTMDDRMAASGKGSKLVKREVSIASGDEVFRHIITAGGIPGGGVDLNQIISAAAIKRSGTLRFSTGGNRAVYGPGVYTYGGDRPMTGLPYVEFRVPQGTAIERLHFEGQDSFFRLVSPDGSEVKLVEPSIHGIPEGEAMEIFKSLLK